MRLLSTTESANGNFEVQDFIDDDIPPHAILSHTWGKGEVTFQDMQGTRAANKEGYEKMRSCCSVAKSNGFKHVWIDTCCIDKTNSVELSEAINSMYRWYQDAEICYVYLADVTSQSDFSNSRWFTRGWTLQELIAPPEVIFYDKDWKILGTKTSLQQDISDCTRIPIAILSADTDLGKAGIAQRMSWAANRKTSRLEDRAYSLMGMFGINMPLIYGEGQKAFVRLQEEIIKVSDDHSIFAWKFKDQNQGGLLATSPDAFEESAEITSRRSSSIATNGSWTVTNKGIHLELSLIGIGRHGLTLAILPCTKAGREDLSVGIFLRDVSFTMERFERVVCDRFELVCLGLFRRSQYPKKEICVRQQVPAIARAPRGQKEYRFDSRRAKECGIASKTTCEDSDWDLFDGRLTNFTDVTKATALLLMPQGKGGDFADEDGRELLSRAAAGGRVEDVRLLLAQRHIETNSTGKSGRTPLSYAAERGHNDVVWLLLARSDVKSDPKDTSGWTPLLHAAKGGHEAVTKMLLKASADTESRDDNGYTPLWWAALGGYEAVVELLLDNGADIESRNESGQTLLSAAASRDHEATIHLLLDKGADIESKDERGWTPLFWAARYSSEAGMKQLLINGANVNAKDMYGRTPLSWATSAWKDIDLKELFDHGVVKQLLDKGANVESKDKNRRTPLSWAAENGNEVAIKLFLDKGAVIKSEDTRGRTPLWWATSKRKEGAMRLLLDKSADK
ncbi:ankyrin repeat-containing domain protein [Cadophora sp. MPI-SDFR-AT-0126]|nr:ankyrin repeat-containing domain protein [Leotiomycetes sp. MPI-SDFR-AT-0126]